MVSADGRPGCYMCHRFTRCAPPLSAAKLFERWGVCFCGPPIAARLQRVATPNWMNGLAGTDRRAQASSRPCRLAHDNVDRRRSGDHAPGEFAGASDEAAARIGADHALSLHDLALSSDAPSGDARASAAARRCGTMSSDNRPARVVVSPRATSGGAQVAAPRRRSHLSLRGAS